MIFKHFKQKTHTLIYVRVFINPLSEDEQMKSLAQSQAKIRGLKESLGYRFKDSATIDTVRETIDSNGFPMLFCSDAGNEAAAQPVIAIRIKPIDAVSKDIFGNQLYAFAPHVLEFAYELDGTEGEPSRKDIIKAMFECAKLGMKIEVKEIADGTAVSATSMDATSATEIEYDIYWKSSGV